MNCPTALSLHNTQRTVQPLGMVQPTPVKDAAVSRLAKSITQLTLCQVTASEMDAATKLLDNACQKLQGVHSQPRGSLTSKPPYANSAKLAAYWIVVQSLPAIE